MTSPGPSVSSWHRPTEHESSAHNAEPSSWQSSSQLSREPVASVDWVSGSSLSSSSSSSYECPPSGTVPSVCLAISYSSSPPVARGGNATRCMNGDTVAANDGGVVTRRTAAEEVERPVLWKDNDGVDGASSPRDAANDDVVNLDDAASLPRRGRARRRWWGGTSDHDTVFLPSVDGTVSRIRGGAWASNSSPV